MKAVIMTKRVVQGISVILLGGALAFFSVPTHASESVKVEYIHHDIRNSPAHKRPVVASLPPLLKRVEAKYFKNSTLIADFQETDKIAALNQIKKSSGKIEYKRPGKIYWETLKPDRNLLVSNGRTFWFYTPPFDKDEPGQYWERNASQVQTRFAQGLLAGTFSSNVARGLMTVRQKSPKEFIIIPKRGTAGTVKQAILHVDPKQMLITGIDLAHRGGNETHIALSNIQLGKPLKDSLFHFTPPPNTEKLKD